MTDVAVADTSVSERFGSVARISSKGAIKDLRTLSDATIEVAIGGAMHRLPVATAAALASAIGEAIEHIRRENPRAMDDVEPTPAEIHLVLKAVEWARLLLAEGRTLDNVTESGVERSALLRRLRSGRAPMAEPPPTSFGQPWYDVLESDGPHTVATDGKLTTLAELLGTQDSSATARNQFLVQVNGCHWNVMKTLAFGTHYQVAYQGHAQAFELAKGEGPSGPVWTLKKVR